MAELTPVIEETSLAANAVPEESSAAAWSMPSGASLACGVCLMVPFLAGLAAVTLGVIGIRQINGSILKMRGRRLAIAGIILGLLNIFGWAAYFRFISGISGPGRTAAHHFFDDLNSADSAGTSRECVAGIHGNRLTAAADQLKSWGGVKSVAVLYITSETVDGMTTGSVRGTVRTPGGEHAFQLQTVCDDDSNWKIRDFKLR